MTRRLAALAAACAIGLATPALLPAAPAVARPTHVAVVVGGVGEACVRAGGDGLETLSAGFRVVYGQPPHYAGFVLTINGKGTTQPDDTHYWSYWHNTGGGWRYSSTGGAGYYPPAGSVEGWSYVDGQSSAPPPPARSYAQVCAGFDPVPAPHTSAARTTATTRAPARTARPSSTTATRSAAVSAVSASRAAPSTSTAARPTPSRPATSAPVPSATPTGTPTSSTPVTAHADARTRHAGVPPWGTLIGIGAVLVLGGSGYWWARRRAQP